MKYFVEFDSMETDYFEMWIDALDIEKCKNKAIYIIKNYGGGRIEIFDKECGNHILELNTE